MRYVISAFSGLSFGAAIIFWSCGQTNPPLTCTTPLAITAPAVDGQFVWTYAKSETVEQRATGWRTSPRVCVCSDQKTVEVCQ